MIDWLEHWYLNQCNGEWEHEFGITIQTTDNPGWLVIIDLSNTKLEEVEMPYILRERAKNDWLGYSIEKKGF